MELTSLDLSILKSDFKQLEDGHIQKAYQRGEELTLEIYVGGEGKKRLLIGTDKAFLTKYKRDNPQKPPGFAMELRKHLGKVDHIKQRGFDRILEIKSGDTKLICEIFGKGNFILTKEGKIIGALRQEEWSDRIIKVGKQYEYPEKTTDPYEIDDYFELFDKDSEIVREIASKLSFGGTYAEETLNRTNIPKDTKIQEINQKEKRELKQRIDEILEKAKKPEPRLYIKDDELKTPKRATPFKVTKYEHLQREEFDKFSEAIDEFYYRKKQIKEEKEKLEAYKEKKEGIERQKEQQERKLEGLKKSSSQNREKAEKIYENYRKINQVKEELRKALEEHGWDEVEQKIRETDNEHTEQVANIDKRNEVVSIKAAGETFKVDPFKDLEAAASQYYDKAKKSESKMESVEKALKETEKQLDSLDKDEFTVDKAEMKDKTKKRSKKWFEKYRWFRTPNDHLVIVGRDAQTNEMAAKKHMENNDLYFHADFDGAPTVILKDGQNSEEIDKEQAAKAAVTFAKTWKAGIGADDIYYVNPDQVTKDPESGEYLSKGAFVIRGDREYMRNVSVEATIGPYEIEDDVWIPVCGPKESIKELCSESVDLEPGHTKKSEIAKEIKNRLQDYDLDLDYIIRALPPGKSEIK